MKKPVIAVDGYSSTGKSSISKEIAKRLGILHLDTGALYRGITHFALQNCLGKDGKINFPNLIEKLSDINLEFKEIDHELILFLNGKNISKEIRENKVSDHVSEIAKQYEVRNFLLNIQREMAQNKGVILDGRDIGTVVFPDADYKFFLTASVDERSKRRFLELESLGIKTDISAVRENLISRDKIDSEREIAPLRKPDDAILIDNTKLNKEETILLMLSYLKEI